MEPIYITRTAVVSPAGWGVERHIAALISGNTPLCETPLGPQGLLPPEVEVDLRRLGEEKSWKHQDRVNRLAVLLVRRLLQDHRTACDWGVIFGSSRGATHTLEQTWQQFQSGERLPPWTSPVSTASSLPAAIARDLGLQGLSCFLSAACSTSLHTILQGVASLRLGLGTGMIVGGAEAANTRFTLNMLGAAKVLSRESGPFPCRPGAPQRSGMVLSEGAAAILLEVRPESEPLGAIIGWGAATEQTSLTGVSAEGEVLQRAMVQALTSAGLHVSDVDLIIGHGSGTIKGDAAELAAYEALFGTPPPLVWHKWVTGHMLGASAAASLVLGLEHLKDASVPGHPYLPHDHPSFAPRQLARAQHALITAMGFGGNACAIIVKNTTKKSSED
jgi:3-oxoacyl-[acyl-carrier-protein] synthase II